MTKTVLLVSAGTFHPPLSARYWLHQALRSLPGYVFEQAGSLEILPRNVSYHSPSQGILRFGWRGPFTQNGQTVDLHPDVRYDNPYVQAAFDPQAIQVRAGGHELTLTRGETAQSR